MTTDVSELFTTTTLADYLTELSEPFPVEDIEWLPNPGSGQAFAFADYNKYKDRLNAVLPGRWSERQPVVTNLGNKVSVSVEVTVCGVPYGGVGEELTTDSNAVTRAYSQAFRRACASFGLGRYMYSFGTTWVNFDDKKRISDDKLMLTLNAYRKLGIPVDAKYDDYKPERQAASVPNRTSSPAPHQPATVSKQSGDKIGYASKAQAGKLVSVGFAFDDVSRFRDYATTKKAVDMAFAGYTAEEIENTLDLYAA